MPAASLGVASILGPHCGIDLGGPEDISVFFPAGALREPLGLNLEDGCASLPRSVEASPCNDDQDSHSPEEAPETFILLLDVNRPPSCKQLLPVFAPPSPGGCLDRCVAGMGETPREVFVAAEMEREEDEAVPVFAGSNPPSSSKEMSLRLRGRTVEVVLLEEDRLSRLFMVAAAAYKPDS